MVGTSTRTCRPRYGTLVVFPKKIANCRRYVLSNILQSRSSVMTLSPLARFRGCSLRCLASPPRRQPRATGLSPADVFVDCSPALDKSVVPLLALVPVGPCSLCRATHLPRGTALARKRAGPPMGTSFRTKALVLFLAYVLLLVVVPSRGAEAASSDYGLKACQDAADTAVLAGHHPISQPLLTAQSYPLPEPKPVLHQSPSIPIHLYRGPPLHP